MPPPSAVELFAPETEPNSMFLSSTVSVVALIVVVVPLTVRSPLIAVSYTHLTLPTNR